MVIIIVHFSYNYHYKWIPVLLKMNPIVAILKGVNLTKYLPIHFHENQKYNQLALLKTVLFAFIDNKRTFGDIEHACKVDLRYLWLSQESTPSLQLYFFNNAGY